MGRHASTPKPPGRRVRNRPPGPPRATGRAPRGPAQARKVVWDWITSAGLVPTEERIAELLGWAWVWVWAPHYRRTAIRLVAAGQAPTHEAVQAATRQMIAANKQAAEQHHAQAAAFVAECGPDAAAWVQGYCATRGHGPLWSELGRALELKRPHVEATIQALHREGWITTGPEARSMRPGPRAQLTPAPETEIGAERSTATRATHRSSTT